MRLIRINLSVEDERTFNQYAKFLMCDTDLSLEAKVIYSYLASFSGSGITAFPSRDKILHDLQIGKDRYYRHYNILLEEGYITVEIDRYYSETKKKVVVGNNIYTLVSNPKKIQEQNINNNKDDSRLKINGMKSLEYETVIKTIMLDPRLSIQSKGIYVYFYTFADSGNIASPKVKDILYHLQISEPTYYNHYKQLIDTNYITTIQRHIDGKLGVNDYYLNESPDEENIKVDNKPFVSAT